MHLDEVDLTIGRLPNRVIARSGIWAESDSDNWTIVRIVAPNQTQQKHERKKTHGVSHGLTVRTSDLAPPGLVMQLMPHREFAELGGWARVPALLRAPTRTLLSPWTNETPTDHPCAMLSSTQFLS